MYCILNYTTCSTNTSTTGHILYNYIIIFYIRSQAKYWVTGDTYLYFKHNYIYAI